MAFSVLTTPQQYVDIMLQREMSTSESICFASSFISSIYFSEEAIQRYYQMSVGDHSSTCKNLMKRRSIAISNSRTIDRREVYESAAFTKFLSVGTVHAHESGYRSRPTEIEEVLQSILNWSKEINTLKIAITTEVLPTVFTIYSSTETLVDIRTNYLYQGIQGFYINDTSSTIIFMEEFERLWRNAITEMTLEDVLGLINENLNQWRNNDEIDLSKWPGMRDTDRARN
jgi:hypothetical protein